MSVPQGTRRVGGPVAEAADPGRVPGAGLAQAGAAVRGHRGPKVTVASKIASAILSFIANTPTSRQRSSSSPGDSAKNIANTSGGNGRNCGRHSCPAARPIGLDDHPS